MTPEELAERLPGRWAIRATTFPMWLTGDRRDPVIAYGVRRRDPLVLDDVVEYRRGADRLRRVVGTDRLRGDGFTWRGVGILALLRSRWRVTGLVDPVLAIRFERSAVTPAGLDVLVREGASIPETRRFVAERTDELGISAEGFAALSWLPE